VAVGNGNTQALRGYGGGGGVDDHAVFHMTPDLHRLLLGFFFFAADIRNHVIQNLRPAFKRLSCAGNCLIGAGENLCHIQIHQRLNSGNIALQRAVGFHGDKAALCAEAFALMIDHADVIGVDLRHHHRNIRRGAVSAVVGNNGALFLCVGFLKRPDLFFFHIDGTEDEIHHRSDAFDVLFCVEQNHVGIFLRHRCRHCPAAADCLCIHFPRGVCAGRECLHREPGMVFQYGKEPLANHSGCADDADFIFFHLRPFLSAGGSTKLCPGFQNQTLPRCKKEKIKKIIKKPVVNRSSMQYNKSYMCSIQVCR